MPISDQNTKDGLRQDVCRNELRDLINEYGERVGIKGKVRDQPGNPVSVSKNRVDT